MTSEPISDKRERERQRHRREYEADPQKFKERAARWAAANPEKRRQINRDYRARNKAARLQRERAIREQDPARFQANQARHRHGKWIDEDWPAMWQAQGGRCYLCGCSLEGILVRIDHDHRCCPPSRSCRSCRRGLACDPCNKALGMINDDVDRMRRMADGLEAAMRAVTARLRADEQLDLLETGS